MLSITVIFQLTKMKLITKMNKDKAYMVLKISMIQQTHKNRVRRDTNPLK